MCTRGKLKTGEPRFASHIPLRMQKPQTMRSSLQPSCGCLQSQRRIKDEGFLSVMDLSPDERQDHTKTTHSCKRIYKCVRTYKHCINSTLILALVSQDELSNSGSGVVRMEMPGSQCVCHCSSRTNPRRRAAQLCICIASCKLCQKVTISPT